MIHGWSAFGGSTTVEMSSNWEEELERWLEPFLDCPGHKARRRMCPLYISGLIGPGDRKSVQPMAARLAPGDIDRLHHFIADGVWDAAPLESELLVQANRLVGGKDAVLGHRRHGDAEEGRSFGWCRSAICLVSRQDGQIAKHWCR
jgi:SRSO17 transposase